MRKSIMLIVALSLAGCGGSGLTREQAIEQVKKLGGKVVLSGQETTLDFSESKLTDEDLSKLVPALSAFKERLELNLMHTSVTEKGLSQLKGVSNLRTLALSTELAKSKTVQELQSANHGLSINFPFERVKPPPPFERVNPPPK